MTTEALRADPISAIIVMNAYRHLDHALFGIAAVNRGDGHSEMSRTSPARGLPSWVDVPKIGCADDRNEVDSRTAGFGATSSKADVRNSRSSIGSDADRRASAPCSLSQ